MNIKQKLEAEAEQIVDAFRKEGGNINELIAKHASGRGLQGDQVRSLVWLINRRNFKQAREQREGDEIALAIPEEVMLFMGQRAKQASIEPVMADVRPGFRVKDANLGGQASSMDEFPLDEGPLRLSKLASRRLELVRDEKIANGKITAALYRMGMLAESVKRAGLLDSQTFMADIDRLPETVRPIIDVVFSHVKVAHYAMPEGQLRTYIERALSDFREMAKSAAEVHAAQVDLTAIRARIRKVDDVADRIRAQA